MLVLILVPLVQLPRVRGQTGVPARASATVQVRYIVILSGRGITRRLVVAGHPRHVFSASSTAHAWSSSVVSELRKLS